jgi:tRNA pseudouridine38-40 synthase
MRSIKLTIAYDGTNYCGWQFQASEASIQGALEEAVCRVTGEQVRITASGRTDSGVHAMGQVASLETNSTLPVAAFVAGVNTFLPPDIRVLDAVEAIWRFDPIREAKWKRYRYQIQYGPIPDVLQRRFSWYQPGDLDIEAMRRGAELLVGEWDFSAFENLGSPRVTSVRHVRELTITRHDTELAPLLRVEIEANGFLYNMVRNIAGSLVQVGKGRFPWSWIGEVLTSRDRRQSGPTAPPQGLFLVHVEYPTTG